MGFAYKKTIAACMGIFLSCILVLSFGLHAFDADHMHPARAHHDTHESGTLSFLSEYAHGAEKKTFLLVLVSVLTASLYVVRHISFCVTCSLLMSFIHAAICRVRSCVRRFNFLCHLLRLGILHPRSF